MDEWRCGTSCCLHKHLLLEQAVKQQQSNESCHRWCSGDTLTDGLDVDWYAWIGDTFFFMYLGLCDTLL